MKKLLTILFCFCLSFPIFSQGSQVEFDLTNSIPQTNDEYRVIKLPAIMKFTNNSEQRRISIINYTSPQDIIESYETHQNKFEFKIDQYKNIYPGNKKIKDEKFLLKIGEADPIEITLKVETSNEVQHNTIQSTSKDAYQPGYIYYDAFKLISKETSFSLKMSILKAYGVDSSNYKNNLYLKVFFEETKDSLPNVQGGNQIGSFITNLGNIDVTYFAAGLARFLAERAKEELNESFFSKMKEELNTYPELKTIFPNTTSVLNVIETYSYASVIQVLKEAFESDIQNLPGNLYKIKNLDPVSECKSNSDCIHRLNNLHQFFETSEGGWISLGMFTLKEAVQSSNPADLLEEISESDELKEIKKHSIADRNLASSIQLLNLISQSLISKDDKQIWVTSSQLSELMKNDKAIKIYLGLLLAKEEKSKDEEKINFYNNGGSITFAKILNDKYGDIEELKNLIKNTFSSFNSANNAAKLIINATDKSVTADPQALYDYYKTFTASLGQIAHNKLLNDTKIVDYDITIGEKYDKIIIFLNPAIDIAYHIATKKYSAAIYDAVVLLDSVNLDNQFMKSFIKYGTLIANVASANSSDEVKRALESSVLPVGSYSIKSKTNFSISINSYVGGYWNLNERESYVPRLGITAPVGINFSKGFSETGSGGSFSLNLQIIDVGALVNYYLLNGDTAALPNDFNVRLSNIFSPGFNICYNFGAFPISLACGGQYIPTLYKIDNSNEFTPTSAWRWQVSALIDIPLLNLKVWDF